MQHCYSPTASGNECNRSKDRLAVPVGERLQLLQSLPLLNAVPPCASPSASPPAEPEGKPRGKAPKGSLAVRRGVGGRGAHRVRGIEFLDGLCARDAHGARARHCPGRDGLDMYGDPTRDVDEELREEGVQVKPASSRWLQLWK
jgi:hypothetical protein